MASISPTERAAEILALCRSGQEVPDGILLPLAETAAACGEEAAAASDALFRRVIEPLADSFEPAHCDTYASVFSRVLAVGEPALNAGDLVARYRRIRRPRHCEPTAHPETVIVLSRVTLGADVAITSIVLDAMKRRFPSAEIYFAGSRKAWELFEADTRICHLPLPYRRHGTLAERLQAGISLQRRLSGAGGIVVDPDSRLTQLGLLPVCEEDRYFFFNSRAYGGDSADSLGQLAKRWVAETFGVVDARSYVMPTPPPVTARSGIAVSFGVGENQDKRVPDPFEQELLRGLLDTGLPVLIDKGPGGEEAARVSRAIAGCGSSDKVEVWDGAFAPFAARILGSRLYVGYDSAGQHVAAAGRVPLLSVFAGFPSQRFLDRWSPSGPGRKTVLRFDSPEPEMAIQATMKAVKALLGRQ